MFFCVRGSTMEVKCTKCSVYYEIRNFWPPREDVDVLCPECGAESRWENGVGFVMEEWEGKRDNEQ